jgi:hypothetical protein
MALWLTLKQLEFMRAVRRGVAGPAVVGFVRPRIVTPADFERRFTTREQAVVLAHERAHIRRQDARANALVATARCLCWFNPFIHVAAFLMRIDQELACDATVVARHPKARRPYAEAMLKAEFADRPLPLGCFWPAGTEHPLTERIAMLKLNRPSPLNRLAGGAALVVLCGGSGLAAWASQPTEVRLVAPARTVTAVPAGVTPAKSAVTDPLIRLAAAEPGPAPLRSPTLASPAPAPQTTANSGLGPATTLQGTWRGMGYKWPASEIFLRDATGRDIFIDTDNSTNLMDEAFANGLFFKASADLRPVGGLVTVKAYPDPDGSRYYADPADITVDGVPLFAGLKPQPGLPAYIARRMKTCGTLPGSSLVGVGSRDPARQVIYDTWNTDCAAKLASTPVGGIPSFTTNTVKQEN